jgi:L-seryl-tRNA(Ser) seleniumtransferase
MIGAAPGALRETAQRWAADLRQAGADVAVQAGQSAIGGGSLPGVTLPTYVLAVRPRGGSVDSLAAALRRGDPPVVGRVSDDRLLLDPRTVAPAEEAPLLAALTRAVAAP